MSPSVLTNLVSFTAYPLPTSTPLAYFEANLRHHFIHKCFHISLKHRDSTKIIPWSHIKNKRLFKYIFLYIPNILFQLLSVVCPEYRAKVGQRCCKPGCRAAWPWWRCCLLTVRTLEVTGAWAVSSEPGLSWLAPKAHAPFWSSLWVMPRLSPGRGGPAWGRVGMNILRISF